jgi:AbrB family looped-hinge helix DNA binding protein
MAFSSIVDHKRRIVLPAEVAKELGLDEGSEVAFEKRKGAVLLKKMSKRRKKKLEEDPLVRAMTWNPVRKGKLEPVVEAEVKGIWK